MRWRRRTTARQLSRIASNTGLRVGDRAADHLQDLGRGGLPLERFLGLVEQPRILDRDHGLVGEGLQQLRLRVGERAGLGARDA